MNGPDEFVFLLEFLVVANEERSEEFSIELWIEMHESVGVIRRQEREGEDQTYEPNGQWSSSR